MIYNPAQPINIIFNYIDDLVEYARAAESELTKSQTINLSLIILKSIGYSKMKSDRGNTQTNHTKRGTTSNTTAANLTLNSHKQEEPSMNSASTTPTPLSTRGWRASESTKTNSRPQPHNTLPHSRPLIKPTPQWIRRCRLSSPKSRPYNSPTL